MKFYIIIFFAMIFTSHSQEVNPKNIHLVRITKEDVQALGGWKLNRKWFAQAIEKTSTAKFVLINLAFRDADILHPESDSYFYSKLIENPHVSIINHDYDADTDSLRIMAEYLIDTSQTTQPVGNDYYKIESSHIRLQKKEIELMKLFSFGPNEWTKEYVYSDIDSNQTMSFLDLMNTDQDFTGKYIFIDTDINGVTSYISEVHRNPISPIELFVSLYVSNYNHQFNIVLPLYYLGILFLINLIVFFYRKKSIVYGFVAFNIALPILFSMMNVSFPLWSAFVFAVPLIFLILSTRKKTEVHVSEDQTIEISNLEVENKKLKEQLAFLDAEEHEDIEEESAQQLGDMIFHSKSPLKKMLKKAEVVAQSEINVLIHGESGTGKEKLAQYIHACSNRKNKPFVAVNCGALTESLIESELFGHEAGAFTGANKQKAGRFEVANEGILFLDEIGETSPTFQVKLLRVLQEGIFERVGGTKPIKVNVRVISATHQNLQKLIDEKIFREDLYYRLSGMVLDLPPLRDRKMDIQVLMQHYLMNKQETDVSLTNEIVEWANTQVWEGNIRQLLSSMDRAVLNAKMKNRKKFLPSDFELKNAKSISQKIKNKDDLADKIIDHLRQDRFQHNSVSSVANLMGLHRATISEYFRAWVIRFLVQFGHDKQKIYIHIVNDNTIEITESFKKKVDKYIATVEEKIESGIKMKLTSEQIVKTQFKNIPNSFVEDLNQLIEIVKKR